MYKNTSIYLNNKPYNSSVNFEEDDEEERVSFTERIQKHLKNNNNKKIGEEKNKKKRGEGSGFRAVLLAG